MAKKRRANNEGTIYQRSDARWYAQISVGGRRLTHYGATQREVKEWRDRKLAEVRRGLNLGAADYLVHWLETLHGWDAPTSPPRYMIPEA